MCLDGLARHKPTL